MNYNQGKHVTFRISSTSASRSRANWSLISLACAYIAYYSFLINMVCSRSEIRLTPLPNFNNDEVPQAWGSRSASLLNCFELSGYVHRSKWKEVLSYSKRVHHVIISYKYIGSTPDVVTCSHAAFYRKHAKDAASWVSWCIWEGSHILSSICLQRDARLRANFHRAKNDLKAMSNHNRYSTIIPYCPLLNKWFSRVCWAYSSRSWLSLSMALLPPRVALLHQSHLHHPIRQDTITSVSKFQVLTSLIILIDQRFPGW